MSSYLVQQFLKISNNLYEGNFFGGTFGKFPPIYSKLHAVKIMQFFNGFYQIYTFNYQIVITILAGKAATSISQLRYNSLVSKKC